ncbi:MAG: ATP-binding protein [Janthinobacterium lividum]
MKSPDPRAARTQLRARAERQRLAASAPPEPADAQHLAQELQVHQIELEMQYEELLLAQADADASHAQYVDLYEFAPVGYCTLAPDGTLAQLNLRLAQLLGPVRQQLLGRRLALYVAPAERLAFSQFLARLWAAPGQRHACELAMLGPGEAPFFAQLEGLVGAVPSDGADAPAACRLALTDVSARRRAADALAASEARFRATFEQSHDGQALLRGQHLVDANAGALRLLGQPDKSRVLGRSLADFWPDDQPGGQPLRPTLLACAEQARAQGWCRHELRRYAAAGQPVWDELSFNPVVVQGEALLHLTWRDVTESEMLRQAVARQQQVLLAAVLTAQEEERRRIAEALHNGVGQLLYATRLHLDALPPSAAVQAGQGLLSEAIRAARTMSFELTPSVLEDLGLPAALRELARRIPAAQLAVDLNLSNLDAPLPAPLATAVYRAVQELLNNVMKHARAREVFVQVAREGPEVHLSVEDDGVGFDAAAPGAPQGLGLAGIRTRVGLLGGTLTIRARPGQGTGVFLVLPVA